MPRKVAPEYPIKGLVVSSEEGDDVRRQTLKFASAKVAQDRARQENRSLANYISQLIDADYERHGKPPKKQRKSKE